MTIPSMYRVATKAKGLVLFKKKLIRKGATKNGNKNGNTGCVF